MSNKNKNIKVFKIHKVCMGNGVPKRNNDIGKIVMEHVYRTLRVGGASCMVDCILSGWRYVSPTNTRRPLTLRPKMEWQNWQLAWQPA